MEHIDALSLFYEEFNEKYKQLNKIHNDKNLN